MDYKSIIESRYNRQNWQLLIRDIFKNKVKFWSTPSVVPTSSQFAKQALWLGTITLSDSQTISIYEVELADSVDIERNRRGIRDMLLTAWRSNGNAGAFMFCYRKQESVLRFSYVSEAWTFAEDGSYQKESTDAKRFTYLLGEGHRSRTAIQQFEKLRDSSLTLKDLTKAFSVDAVSDMFFDGYKKQYEDIIQYITGKRMVKVANKWEEQIKNAPCEEIMQEFAHFPNPEKAVRDYVKKLMGRLVFLQFLQKKGWLGVPVNASWGEGDREFIQNLFAECEDKDRFIDNTLETLFNDLNTEREGDLSPLTSHHSPLKIPYLNGGLFERDATDETEFPLPAKYMQSLLDFFASYNFTIDENDPDDAEVGVDPEMLGRIFENLLEDNKDKGAFYTPKEIVSYMCRESLIAYLQTNIEDEATKEAIRQFVTTHDAAALRAAAPLPSRGGAGVGSVSSHVDQLLKDVKICDPAIGSGAFPMGLLKELFQCRTALEGIEQSKAAEIKKHIIQQNIYGVDIEPGAVDIARLRFWLSLIVDEETPQALPNLDFKIMQGNSLLEQYKGVDLSTMTEKKYNKSEGLSFFDNMVDVYREELRNMLAKYYNCTDHNEKKELRANIINNVKKQLAEQRINADFGDLDLSGNNQFFLWHTWFYDVFSQGGFDIVIGNPPYFNVETLGAGSSYINSVKSSFKYIWQDKSDILFYFFGLALQISSNVVNFIVSNAFLFSNKAQKLRNCLLEDGRLAKIVNFEKYLVFNDASITTCITTMYKTPSFDAVVLKGDSYSRSQVIDYISDGNNQFPVKLNKNSVFALIPQCIGSINEKIDANKPHLSDIVVIGSGMQVGANKVFIFDDYPSQFPPKYIRKRVAGNLIKKFAHVDNKEWLLYVEETDSFEQLPISVQNYLMLNKEVLCNRADKKRRKTAPWWNYTFSMHKELYTHNKIWCSYRAKSNIFAWDESSDFIGLTNVTAIFDTNKDVSLKYVLALLNSKVLTYRYKSIGKQTGGGIYEYIPNGLGKLPIPLASKKEQVIISDLVNDIMQIKEKDANADTSALESEIDRLVYQLYGLTDEEIAIIEKK